ncbi:MAG: cytochrome c [Alphaproteobacteria bacterium]
MASDAGGETGRSLYLRHCAICHGVDLKGRDAGWQPSSPYVPPLDYSGKSWRLTDMQMEAIMSAGSHAAQMRLSNLGMPPFAGRLSGEEAASIAAYMKEQWTPGDRALQAETTRRAARSDADLTELGKQLYATKCAICHGAGLEGRIYRYGEAGRVRDLAVPALAHNIFAQAMSDDTLRLIVLHGERHIPLARSDYRMPDLLLDADDAGAIVLYLRTVWRDGVP